jgi:hypothetical protein
LVRSRKGGEIPGEKEAGRGEEVGEPYFGDGRSEETGIGAFRPTRDVNGVRGVEGVEVEGATQTSKGSST